MIKRMLFAAFVGIFATITADAQVVYEADFSDTVTFPNGTGAGEGGADDPYVGLIGIDGFDADKVGLTLDGTATGTRFWLDEPDRGFGGAVNVASAVVAAGESYSSTTNFTFGVQPTGGGNSPILQTGVFNGPFINTASGTVADRLAMSLTRGTTDPNIYRLRLVTNWGNTYPTIDGVAALFQQSPGVAEDLLGLNFNTGGAQDLQADNLQLVTKLTAGADTDSWTVVGTLTNLDTASEILTYTVENVSFAAAGGANVYGGLGLGQNGTNSGITDIAFSTFKFEASNATGGILGDFDNDGDVDLTDLDQYNGNIGAAATGALEALDLNGDGTVGADDFQQHYSDLVETSNGQTGTFAGDVNLDGTVNVLGDAFALVGNLNNAATSWSQGDLDADGTVNVLGDGFALVGNLGSSNAQ